MKTLEKLAQDIEREYFDSFSSSPFPLKDVFKLKAIDRKNWNLLHAGLDNYFMYVAGYASGAVRLARRPRSELAEAKKNLARSFFETFDSLSHYGGAINKKATPELFQQLTTIERLRKQLVVLMDEILRHDRAGKPGTDGTLPS